MPHYASVNIKNPISLFHVAKVWPGQEIVLSLDDRLYPNARVEAESTLLQVVSMESNGEKQYYINQSGKFDIWSKYSSCFLGDVWIVSDTTIARLLVVLQSFSVVKSEHLTVVNPDNATVKICPHQVLELVVYDERFGYQDEWNYDWTPSASFASTGLDLDELGHDHLTVFGYQNYVESKYDDDPDLRYARYPRLGVVGDDFCRQHHFWFRFNSAILDTLDREGDNEFIGTVSIRGYQNQYQKHATHTVDFKLGVYADLKSKFRSKILRTLQLRPENNKVVPPPVRHYHSWPQARPTATVMHFTRKPHLLFLKEVCINKVVSELGEGCKTAEAVPPERRLWNQFHEDDDYYFIGNLDARSGRAVIPGHKYRGEWD